MTRRWWILALSALSAGCTLISLDELQSSLSSGGAGGGGGAAASGGATSNTGGQGGATNPQGGGGNGSGGADPIYDACVLSDGPSLYLRMTPSSSPESNLGSLMGNATVTGFSAAGPSLVAGGDGARSFLSDMNEQGSLVFDADPVFAGGLTSTTIELWFRTPDWSAALYPLVVGASPATLTLRLERRFDAMGDDAIYFVGRNGSNVREVKHFANLLDPPVQDHHLVVVYRQSATTMFNGNGDADDLLLYLDGQLVESMGHGDQVEVAPVAPPLTIGQGYQGLIDELAIYPFELSAERVQAHYDAGHDGVPCP